MTDDRRPTTRRRVLQGTVTAAVGGTAGCVGSILGGGDDRCPDGEVTVEGPGDASRCVVPVEGDRPVGDYYNYGGGETDSASTPDGLEANDATVLFVYRDTTSDERSLVVLNGDAAASSDGGGGVAMTFEGVEGYQWQVQDGPPGPGSGDVDPYQTGEGSLGASESVIWGWNDRRTDGGAIGPLGDSFDVTAVHRAEGSVGDQTKERTGVDRLLLVDGNDLGSYVELATIDGDTGDLSVRLSAGG